jgi:hypothetical protein
MVNNVLRDATEAEAAEIDALRALVVSQPPVVPQSVTRRQARQALLLRGLLASVPTAIAAITDDTQRGLATIEWEDSQVFERSRPLVQSIGAALNLTPEQLDDLFVFAATL